MSARPGTVALIAALVCVAPVTVRAESVLDRRIGFDVHDLPFVLNGLDSTSFGRLAAAAGVPLGLEMTPGPVLRPVREVKLTGLTVREALDEIQRLDSRYVWQEMDGVVVLRPRASWNFKAHPLNVPTSPLQLEGISARHALRIACGVLNTYNDPKMGHGDTHIFSVRFDGGTLLEMLNAFVRAHGRLVWVWQTDQKSKDFPYTISILGGGDGMGCGVRGVRREEPPPIAEYLADMHRAPQQDESVLERVVPPGIKAHGMFDSLVIELAAAVHVPVVFERAALAVQGLEGDGLPLGGFTFRNALDTLVAIDPRYSWREIDGVIVIRPLTAWGDSAHPLFTAVPAIELKERTLADAVAACLRGLRAEYPLTYLGDTRRVTIDLPQGSVLDLLIAVARAHGQLSWVFRPADADDQKRGMRYVLQVQRLGSGTGDGFLVR